jgi:hypothetical protein
MTGRCIGDFVHSSSTGETPVLAARHQPQDRQAGWYHRSGHSIARADEMIESDPPDVRF